MSDMVNITVYIVALISFIIAAVAALSLWKREKDMPSYEEVKKTMSQKEFYENELGILKDKFAENSIRYEEAKELADKLELLKDEWSRKEDMRREIDEIKKAIEDEDKILGMKKEEVADAFIAEDKKLENHKAEINKAIEAEDKKLWEHKAEINKAIEVEDKKLWEHKAEINKAIEVESRKFLDHKADINKAIEVEDEKLANHKSDVAITIETENKKLADHKADIAIAIEAENKRLADHKADIAIAIEAENKSLADKKTEIDKAIEAENKKLADHKANIAIATEVEDKKLVELKAESENLSRQNAILSGEKNGLEIQIQQLTDYLKVLNSQLPTKELTKEEAAKSLESLWTPIQLNTYKGSFANKDENAMITKVNDKLRSKGLLYHERVINSFHTNLKINEISPLTVLAGISGTGKSLLPMIYCEAMGINFLSLAVQPRWDSPQDLFGFYNYMEKRYVSTDLARAMVEFERYDNNIEKLEKLGATHAGGRKDQMLLVLFDEMNLARIEYYFSEFLSRLETRRDIDVTKPEERQKAQLKIEAGQLKDIFLFPSNNLLFVGTMNEDESTQSLSDKVMDRASILRFGKPTRLASRVEHANAECQEQGPCLPRESWEKWINPNEPDNEICNTIESLNQIMNDLGRPFGHRVGKAIKQYISNYPQGENHINLALADQIEQRIIPKLRGLSVSENKKEFEAIGNILTKRDQELAQQFKTCLDNAQNRGFGTFNWLGFDRTSAK